MSKHIVLKGFGSIDNLVLEERKKEPIEKGEVRIKVMASALNRDQFKYIISGEYGQSDISYSESLIGYEGAGIVTEVGEGVDKSWIGKEVIPIGAFNVKKYGTLGEEAIVPAERLIEKPKNISFINGTAIWVPFITAYGLISSGNIKKGDTVLITAANSVVGMAAIEIAEKVGAIPIGTVRSEKNREKLRKLGIKNIIISGEKNFKEEIFKLTDGRGVDIVFDSVGGEFLMTASSIAAYGGTIVEYGVMGGLDADFPVADVIGKNLTIKGFTMDSIFRNEKIFEESKKFILDGFEKGEFNARVASVFKLKDYKAAYEELRNSGEIGRIVIEME